MTGRVLVGIPLGSGGVPAETFEALVNACRGYEVKTFIGRTELNRNRLCQYALEQGYDRLVMLDVDHKHPPDVVGRLVAHQVPVVAALAFRRMAPYDPMAYVKTGDTFEIVTEWTGGLMQVTWVASCAVCIETAVLKRVQWPWWHYPTKRKFLEGAMRPPTDRISAECPSEDIGFCENCRIAGVPVYCDTGLVTPHLTVLWADDNLYRAVIATARGE